MRVPTIKGSPSVDPYLESADMSLPVFPNGNVVWHTDCTCRSRSPGRTMVGEHWVVVCMTCGSLREGSGT